MKNKNTGTKIRAVAAYWLCGILCLCLLCSCAKQSAVTDPEEPLKESGAEQTQAPLYDFRSRTAAHTGEAKEGETLKLAAYCPYEIPDGGETERTLQTAVSGDGIVAMVERFYESADGQGAESGETECKKYCFTLDAGTEKQEFKEPAPGLKEVWEKGTLAAVRGDTYYLLELEHDRDPQDGLYTLSSCKVVHVDGDGKELGSTDLTECCRELGLTEKSEYRQTLTNLKVDPNGCCYLTNDFFNATVLYRLQENGRVRTIADCSGKRKGHIAAGRAWDGTSLFAERDIDEDAWVFFWVDEESGEKKEFGRLPAFAQEIVNFCLSDSGICYYATRATSVYRWDLNTGAHEKVYHLRDNAISGAEHLVMIATREGDLHLYEKYGEEPAMIGLNGKGMEAETVLTVWTGYPEGEDPLFLYTTAAAFMRTHPWVRIEFSEVRTDPQERETEFTRLTGEILTGKAPDLLCLLPPEMELLWEKGALADMSGYVSEEMKGDLLPHIWESGMRDGRPAGLCGSGGLSTLITGKNTWDKENWGIMDITGLLEQGKVKYLMPYQEGALIDDKASNLSLLLLACGMKNMPFLDLEKKQAFFTGEEFKRFLSQIKKYDNRYYEEGAQVWQSLAEGECLVRYASMQGLGLFSAEMRAAGDECRIIGFPDGESAMYFTPYIFLSVGAGTENGEAVREFLEYYLKTAGRSLRESTLRENVTQDENGNWFLKESSYSVMLDTKADGSTYLEDYLEWMKRGNPEPRFPEEIRRIITEETDKYFAGGQDLERTCELIQNRVQLYLDEE